MSKLILEMEMPRFCAECPMCDNVYYGDDVRKSFCVVFDERKEILTEDRPTWCPIKGELVRCGECKYFVKNTWECVRLSDRFGDEYSDATVYPEYFCADGERRTDGNTAENE